VGPALETVDREQEAKTDPVDTGAPYGGARERGPLERNADSEPLTGRLVDEVPSGAKVLHAQRINDAQTEVRADGVGPRLYDPTTKSTVPFHELDSDHERAEP
jgi:hypothetical protein